MENTQAEPEALTEAQAVIDLAARVQPVDIKTIGTSESGETINVAILTDTDGTRRIKPIKPYLDEYASRPDRVKGCAKLSALDSFIGHVNRFKNTNTAIFANDDRDQPSLKAVIDYHHSVEGETDSSVVAEFMGHRSIYEFPLSNEWKAWQNICRDWLSQHQLAEFLQDHIVDVMVPDIDPTQEDPSDSVANKRLKLILARTGDKLGGPAELIDASRSLKVNTKESFHQAQNLSTGEAEFVFKKEQSNERGEMVKLPNAFLVAIPVFRSGELYRMLVRLKYRTQENKLSFGLEIYRADQTFDTAFSEAVEMVREKTALPVFIGLPET